MSTHPFSNGGTIVEIMWVLFAVLDAADNGTALHRRYNASGTSELLHTIGDDATVVGASGHATRKDSARSGPCPNKPWRPEWRISKEEWICWNRCRRG
jgi:hypothetical protein